MNILVTGGSGGVGKGVVKRLVNSGHHVRAVDWRIGSDPHPGAEYHECDITNFSALREEVRGMDGIIHLAAFAYPAAAPSAEMFRVNCAGTYNVFECAAQEGIRKLACASSINALGFNFGIKPFPIAYFPVDEDHPTFTTDPYSFSKETVEAIARYYWRRDGISSVCMRMPFVYTWSEEFAAMAAGFIQKYTETVGGFLALPDDARSARLAELVAGINQMRADRAWEKPYEGDENDFDPADGSFLLSMGYTDFWSIISVEDTAQAFEKALLAGYEGTHPLFVSERENSTGLESEALLRAYFPEVTARKQPIPGCATMLSYDRARALIGYEPEYAIRERAA